MKKILVTTMFVIVMMTMQTVLATDLANYLPGGKNYIDINNMLLLGNELVSDDDIYVKEDTDYTISFPGFDMLGDPITIDIQGRQDTYVNGDVSTLTNCSADIMLVECQFHTAVQEQYLSISITSQMIELYFTTYGVELFQLEEGLVATTYEEYIPPYVDANSPEFDGSGAYVKSYQIYETIQSIIDTHIVAYDDVDGDISDQIQIISDTYTGNEMIVGTYLVELYVEDSSGNSTTFALTVIVKDEIAPVIEGPNQLVEEVDNQYPILDIITSNYTIYDEYDPAPSIDVTSDNYTPNLGSLGHQIVTFSVTDSSGNTTNKTIDIHVVDTVVPTMNGERFYTSYLSNPLDLTDILNAISFEDNYDDLSTVTPTITRDTFTGNENQVGSYVVDLQVTDSSGNTLSEHIDITVEDDIYPELIGPASYTASYQEELELSDIINMFSVSDNVDSLEQTDIVVVLDEYTTRTTEVGSFLITLAVSDTAQNTTEHTITVNIYDDLPPIIYIDDYIITVSSGSTFNARDALSLLIQNNELSNQEYDVTMLLDEYEGNENITGEYQYHLSFTDEQGNTFVKEFIIAVQGVEEESIPGPNNVVRSAVIYGVSFTFMGFVIFKKMK